MLDSEGVYDRSKQRPIYQLSKWKKKCFLPRLWMDVFDWSEVMCLALSTASQSTASCFLASASSPYTQGLAHLASARKQDLD